MPERRGLNADRLRSAAVQDALGNPQSALILGGTSEIALATVDAMAGRRLRHVVLAGRDLDAMEKEAERLRGDGLTVEVERFDALDTGSHDELVDRVFDRLSDVDLVLAAAAVLGDQEEAERSTEEAVRVTATNYVGMVSVLLAVARRMRRQGHGTVVVMSSVAGERVRRANFVYGSSKAGLDGFAQGLGDSLVGTGAKVLIVRPGFVRTKMTEGMEAAPFAATPDQVAEAIVSGVAKGARVVHVPKVLRWVFVVMRHLPVAVWRRMPR